MSVGVGIGRDGGGGRAGGGVGVWGVVVVDNRRNGEMGPVREHCLCGLIAPKYR